MAPQSRRNGTDLIAQLERDPGRFRFFQAIRLLRLAESSAGRGTALPRGLRFRTPPSLAFPPGEILRFQRRAGQDPREEPPCEMEVTFLGLTGPSGVLPHPYTEALMDAKAGQRDGPAHAFFDLFSHRAVSLFCEAWQKYRFHIAYELGQRGGFTQHLLDLIGMPRPCPRDGEPPPNGSVPIELLACFSGVLGRRPLPSSSLVSMLAAFFGARVTLEQFVGQWIEVPAREQSSLGGARCVLGWTAVLGQRAWDRQTKVRLRIGPLDRTAFPAFHPGRPAASALRRLLETCCGQALACDVVPILRKEDAPFAFLASRARMPSRLGLDTWIRTAPPRQDLDDVSYRLL